MFFFFCGGRGSNPKPCIYYALSIQTELSSQGDIHIMFVTSLLIFNLFLTIYYMYYLYSKLRVFLEREKISPKKLKEIVFFIYNIDT